MVFLDRDDAGRRLARALLHLRGKNPVVVGLPRGGVPVAAQVARVLEAPLDVIVVRKLGIPYQPEVAMGAIGERDVRLVDWDIVSLAGVSASEVREVIERERGEVRRRARWFRDGRAPLDLEDRTVIVVDDGIATGSTIAAAVRVARSLGAESIVVAAPVAPADVVERLRRLADDVVVLETPEVFAAVGQAYAVFDQVSDDEVARTLLESRERPFTSNHPVSSTI